MTDLAFRYATQIVICFIAFLGGIYGLRNIKTSMATNVVIWLWHVVLFYSFIFAFRLGWIPKDVYVAWLSPWTPSLRLHGVIAAVFVLVSLRIWEQHGY